MKLAKLFQQEDRTALEKWCRAHVQQAYLGDNTALCRVLGQFLMYVDTRDLSLTPHLMMNGFWEMWVTQAIANYVKPGMYCIDVGANAGYYTLLLAELAGDGIIFAYEPQRRLMELLKRSAAVNGVHINLSWEALSSESAPGDNNNRLLFYKNNQHRGSASLRPFKGSDETVEVYVNCLDNWEHPSVDFVKIDVQGHELQVLEGMKRTIARSPGIAIAMEFTPKEHDSPIDALKIIESYGLKIETIGTDGTVRPVSLDEAIRPDTGDHRMLWLTRSKNLTPAPDPT